MILQIHKTNGNIIFRRVLKILQQICLEVMKIDNI